MRASQKWASPLARVSNKIDTLRHLREKVSGMGSLGQETIKRVKKTSSLSCVSAKENSENCWKILLNRRTTT